MINLGKYSSLNYKAWPDIKKITARTAFSWYNKVPAIHDQQKLEFKIDIQVCRHLWNSICSEKGDALVEVKSLGYLL